MDSRDDLDWEFVEVRHHAGVLLRTMAGGTLFPFATPGTRPAVDVYETSDALVVVLEAPGLSASELEVYLERQYLRVRGQRARLAPEDAIRCHRCEIDAGPFDLLIPLPYPPGARHVETRLDMGLLRIILPIHHGSGGERVSAEEDSA